MSCSHTDTAQGTAPGPMSAVKAPGDDLDDPVSRPLSGASLRPGVGVASWRASPTTAAGERWWNSESGAPLTLPPACGAGSVRLWGCIPSPAEQREMAKPGSWAPSAAPYSLHSTIHNILIALFIVESSKYVQRKSPEQDGGGGRKQGQPIEAQRTTLPARSTDCPPVIAHSCMQSAAARGCVKTSFLIRFSGQCKRVPTYLWGVRGPIALVCTFLRRILKYFLA